MNKTFGIRKNYVLVVQYAMLAIGLLVSSSAKADVAINPLFGDNAVLQQGVAIPVWGTGAESEQVTIEFEGQKLHVIANGGNWMVKLKPLKV